MVAGRQLWQQQASRNDLLKCSPFNGPVELLRGAAAAPMAASQHSSPDSAQLDAARAAFATTAKAVAMQGAANSRSRGQPGSSSSNPLDVFRRAIIMPQQPGGDDKSGVLPPQAADAAAEVAWDGSDKMTAVVQAGPSMNAAAARTATEALHDGAVNMVPWITIKVRPTLLAEQKDNRREGRVVCASASTSLSRHMMIKACREPSNCQESCPQDPAHTPCCCLSLFSDSDCAACRTQHSSSPRLSLAWVST
jgi:hypothetical protein